MSITEINDEFNKYLKNQTLEEKRKIVSDNIDKINEKENINNIYLDFIKYLIKDNTNKKLLKKYLKFLKSNETQLAKNFGENFESFNNEISQYQSCFCLLEIPKELEYDKTNSEREKLIYFLKDLSSKKNKDEIENFINSRKYELDKFRFNQPISFEDNPELYYCRCRMILLYNIKNILNENKTKKIDNMKYCVNEVLNRDFFNNSEIINNKSYITHIMILMAVPQRELITNYNLNLIDNKDIDVTEIELNNLGFHYNNTNKTYIKDDIIINQEEISLFNLKNLKLYMNLDQFQKKAFKIYELYKYNELFKYYSNNFDESKIRTFLSKI